MSRGRIWLFPIEPIEERYSEQWLRWWGDGLKAAGFELRIIMGARLNGGIGAGQFLDIYDTNYFKATQLAVFAQRLRSGEVKDGDVVFLLDAWNAEVTSLAYMRDAGGHKFKLAGFWHAGTYDPWDFLTQRGLDRWAAPIESAWCTLLDRSYVATRFHAELLIRERGLPQTRVRVVGLPVMHQEWQQYRRPWSERPPCVVFPHRLAPEKAPEEFAYIESEYRRRWPDDPVQFVRTKDVWSTKHAYYSLLGSSRVAVSTARQETFGIAMVEAQSLGCWCIAPNRLSYSETMEPEALYVNLDDAVILVRGALARNCPSPYDETRWTSTVARVADDLAGL